MSVTVEVLVVTQLRVLLHEKQRRGVTDEALLNVPSRPFQPRTYGKQLMGEDCGVFSHHTVRSMPDDSLHA